ncbi:DUF5977 domain-containing protein [uncultured Acetobacteroides sp.]|uniref:DUF5977 domain-containing protein n=1 Tax=uncultured Acetobacteroides sp. TaxID=1760811 RepID=UPI0029F51225|nr:DUF5977 domain-containing protein [uncultured Acetobacteroides sp.]
MNRIFPSKPDNGSRLFPRFAPRFLMLNARCLILVFQLFLSLMLGLNAYKLNAQGVVQPSSIPSPNAIGMGMGVTNPVNLYTGTVAVNVPIRNLNERGITLPIALSYDGSGVRPEQHPTWVGQNWNLSAGGSIVRVVNNWPDEAAIICLLDDPTSGTSKLLWANYFSNCKDLLQFKNDESSLKVIADKSSKYSHLYSYSVYGKDYQPDVFIFNFLGFTGQFFLGNDGKWKVSSSQNIKVVFDYNDSSNFDYPFVRYSPDGIAEYKKTINGFKLIDDKGTTYVFGYDANAIEYTLPFFGQSKKISMSNQWVANAWHLTKVIDKYGVEVYNLKYARGYFIGNFYNADGTTIAARADDMDLYSSSDYTITNNIYLGDMKCTAFQFQEGKVSGWLISPCYLSTIYSQGRTVAELNRSVANDIRYSSDEFIKDKSSERFYYLYNSNSAYRYPNADVNKPLSGLKWYKLNSIKFEDNTTANFVYNDSTGSTINERLNLIRIEIKGNPAFANCKTNRYKFYYNKFNQLPGFLSKMVDHWGFYNGHVYSINMQNLGQYSKERDPNASFSSIGILKKIEFPTGGFIEYVYEPHTYASNLSEKDSIAGGLRIKNIVQYDGSKIYAKEYRYVDRNKYGDRSSGVLSFMPKYYYEDMYYNGSASRIAQKVFSVNSIIPSINMDESHIGYSCVQEVSKDESYSEYKFSTSFMYKDEKPFSFTPSAFDPGSSNRIRRGVLLEKTDYDSTGILVCKTNYRYDTFGKENEFFVYSSYANNISSCPTNTYSYYNGGVKKLYYYDFLPVEIETTRNYNGKEIVTEKISNTYVQPPLSNDYSYFYTGGTSFLKETTKKTDRGILTTKITYPFDYYPLDNNPFMLFLCSEHRIGEVVETSSTLNGIPNGYTVNGYNDFGVPRGEGFSLVPKTTSSSSSDKSNIKTNIVIDKVDNWGNTLQITKRGGGIESVVYGYNSRLPIIKLIDVNYDDFISYLASKSISISMLQTSDTVSLMGYIKTIRSDFYKTFPKGYILNTLYNSEGGVVKEIDARGNCVKTEYDSFGVPILKRDSKDNILNFAETNSSNTFNREPIVYKNFAISKQFQKRDCQGSTGTMVTYRVPSNKYSSLISQEKADSLALNDINNNGQNYGNMVGLCTKPYVKLDVENINKIRESTYADIKVSFFYDEQLTKPASVLNFPVKYTLTEKESYAADKIEHNELLCTGASFSIGYHILISDDYTDTDGDRGAIRRRHIHTSATYELEPSPNYSIQKYGNIEMSQEFYKNDGFGSFFSNECIAYRVPSNTYFSSISQDDANQKAKDDIAKNGQAYANTHGSCIPRILKTDVNSVEIEVHGHWERVQVEANSDYKVTSVVGDFISTAIDYGDNGLEISCTENKGAARSGSVTLGSGSKQVVISVNQAGISTK